MQLIIDIGNTRIKFALFKEQTFLVKGVGDVNDLKAFCKGKAIEKAIISSVSKSELVEEFLIKNKIYFIHLSHKTKLPIIDAVYDILYEGKDPKKTFKKLTEQLD